MSFGSHAVREKSPAEVSPDNLPAQTAIVSGCGGGVPDARAGSRNPSDVQVNRTRNTDTFRPTITQVKAVPSGDLRSLGPQGGAGLETAVDSAFPALTGLRRHSVTGLRDLQTVHSPINPQVRRGT